MEKFDLIVIGSGPAGFAAAMRALDFGKHVCLLEAKNLGGAGILNGALTSKAMWELSHDYAIAAKVSRGYRASGLSVDYKQVRKTVIEAAKEKQYQMLSQIETFSPEKSEHGSLSLKYGRAKFLDFNTVELSKKNGEKELLKAQDFVIATGARPREYPGIPIDRQRIIDSEGVLSLEKFPERMLIIGSGIIGCEFATIFSNFGQTKVHLLDRSNRVIPYEDNDLSDFVSENLTKNGVVIHHTAQLRTIRKHKTHLEVVLDYQDGHSKVIEVDVALISIGRIPNTDNLGLDKLGIEVNRSKYLKINDICMIENNPKHSNIYAAGDITGHGQLYNIAELQGRYAVKSIYNKVVFPLNYENMSTLMFFKPEVAAVGMNEKTCRHKKISYQVAYYSNQLVNRTIAMRNTNGFVKIIVSNNEEKRILGMRAAGPQASAFIVSIAQLIDRGSTLAEMSKIVHPHPSVTEGIQACLRVFDNKSVFKPKAFPNLIKLATWTAESD